MTEFSAFLYRDWGKHLRKILFTEIWTFSLWTKKTFSVKIIYSLGQVIVTVNVSLATLFDTQYIDKQKSYGVVTYHLILD